jgi:hypothetical protein
MTTVIIGAGPYGLSVAANLLQRYIPFRIFGRTMSMWSQHMPKGMLVKSDGFATNFGDLPLTLERFCQETNRPYAHRGYRVPVEDVIAYGRAIQERYVGAVDDRRVISVTRSYGGFLVHLNDGEEVYAERVIVATGLKGFERLPEIRGLRPGYAFLTHSSEHSDLAAFAGRNIVVIGGGQSAVETAALLHEQGAAQVTVLSRSPLVWFAPEKDYVPNLWTKIRHPSFGMGGWKTILWSEMPQVFHRLPRTFRIAKAYSTFGPAGSGWMRHRVLNMPGIDLQVGYIRQIDGNNLQVKFIDDGVVRERTIVADHIIAATGFKYDLRKIRFLASLLPNIRWTAEGIPWLNGRYETTVPGLHVVGILSAVAWGPSMRFIYGTNFVAPLIARSLSKSSPPVQVNPPLTKRFA